MPNMGKTFALEIVTSCWWNVKRPFYARTFFVAPTKLIFGSRSPWCDKETKITSIKPNLFWQVLIKEHWLAQEWVLSRDIDAWAIDLLEIMKVSICLTDCQTKTVSRERKAKESRTNEKPSLLPCSALCYPPKAISRKLRAVNEAIGYLLHSMCKLWASLLVTETDILVTPASFQRPGATY